MSLKKYLFILHLGYPLMGGLFLLIGFRLTKEYLGYDLNRTTVDCFWSCVCWGTYQFKFRWILAWWLGAALIGVIQIVYYLLLVNNEYKSQNRTQSPNRQYPTYHTVFLLFGGLLLFMGLQHTIFFLKHYLTESFNLIAIRTEIGRGIILTIPAGGLIVLAYLSIMNKNWISGIGFKQQKRWLAIYLGNMIIGVLLLLVGLQNAIPYIEEYQKQFFIFPSFCKNWLYAGLAFAVASFILLLPHLFRKFLRKIRNKSIELLKE